MHAVLSNNPCIKKQQVDGPYCTCGDIEDAQHYFLFVCHQFTDLKHDLISSEQDICQPNLNVLLYGEISLTFDSANI